MTLVAKFGLQRERALLGSHALATNRCGAGQCSTGLVRSDSPGRLHNPGHVAREATNRSLPNSELRSLRCRLGTPAGYESELQRAQLRRPDALTVAQGRARLMMSASELIMGGYASDFRGQAVYAEIKARGTVNKEPAATEGWKAALCFFSPVQFDEWARAPIPDGLPTLETLATSKGLMVYK